MSMLQGALTHAQPVVSQSFDFYIVLQSFLNNRQVHRSFCRVESIGRLESSE